ncbi:LOW QUALITY PROTEIN: uncharacterized protein M6D78_017119 [Vipera latastei]
MNIIFTEPCILHENSHTLKIKVEPQQLNDLFYCENLKEIVTTVQLNRQMVEEHEYCIHQVLLNCFLQMVGVLTFLICKQNSISSISSLVAAQCLEEEMVIYLKTSTSAENYL